MKPMDLDLQLHRRGPARLHQRGPRADRVHRAAAAAAGRRARRSRAAGRAVPLRAHRQGLGRHLRAGRGGGLHPSRGEPARPPARGALRSTPALARCCCSATTRSVRWSMPPARSRRRDTATPTAMPSAPRWWCGCRPSGAGSRCPQVPRRAACESAAPAAAPDRPAAGTIGADFGPETFRNGMDPLTILRYVAGLGKWWHAIAVRSPAPCRRWKRSTRSAATWASASAGHRSRRRRTSRPRSASCRTTAVCACSAPSARRPQRHRCSTTCPITRSSAQLLVTSVPSRGAARRRLKQQSALRRCRGCPGWASAADQCDGVAPDQIVRQRCRSSSASAAPARGRPTTTASSACRPTGSTP
jgi:hypothetical protein